MDDCDAALNTNEFYYSLLYSIFNNNHIYGMITNHSHTQTHTQQYFECIPKSNCSVCECSRRSVPLSVNSQYIYTFCALHCRNYMPKQFKEILLYTFINIDIDKYIYDLSFEYASFTINVSDLVC